MSETPLPLAESYWVIPGHFLAGEYPGNFDEEGTRRRLDALLEAGLDTFINLTRPDELPSYEKSLNEQARLYERTLTCHNFPIADRGLPTASQMTAILDTIDAALAANHKVYLHCWGGVGRTGTAVGCYLVRHGRTGAQALEQLAAWWREVPKRSVYPRSPETDEQVGFILDWQK